MNDLTTIEADKGYGLSTKGMAPGLALLFNDRLYERCKEVAKIMAGAQGFTPPHLIGKSEACFGVVQMSITWRLTPQLVAASTYATPGGKIGYEGKLVQAILENSGQLVGGIGYEEFGDWSKIMGKFKIGQSAKGNAVPQQGWKTPDDEVGLGVVVSAQVRGESERRSLRFLMAEAFPRNSILWSTRPLQQLKYTACRAFANTVMPGVFMGVPFDTDADAGGMIDVTPAGPARPSTSLAKPSEASIDENYQHGREAFANGIGARQVPGYLSALDADAWMRGWQDASRQSHEGTAEQQAAYADEIAAADPETGEIVDPAAARSDAIMDAEADGEAAFLRGEAKLPATYGNDKELSGAWVKGWKRVRDRSEGLA